MQRLGELMEGGEGYTKSVCTLTPAMDQRVGASTHGGGSGHRCGGSGRDDSKTHAQAWQRSAVPSPHSGQGALVGGPGGMLGVQRRPGPKRWEQATPGLHAGAWRRRQPRGRGRPNIITSARRAGSAAGPRLLSRPRGSRCPAQRLRCPALGCLLPGRPPAGCSAWARRLTRRWGCPPGCADRPLAACPSAHPLAPLPPTPPALQPASLRCPRGSACWRLGRVTCRQRWAAACAAARLGTGPGLQQGEGWRQPRSAQALCSRPCQQRRRHRAAQHAPRPGQTQQRGQKASF